jgi:bacteriocin-like protein
MDTETKQVEMTELSDTELNQVSGGGLIEFLDTLAAAFVGRDRDGKGPILHFFNDGSNQKK